MGLDVVELIMRAEEEFEIEIGDEEAEQCATAGQLTRLIAFKLNVAPEKGFELEKDFGPSLRCSSSAMFYQTRRNLMAITGVSRREIRPKTRLAQLFSPRNRPQQWQQLRVSNGANLPDLMMSPWVMWALALGFGILLFAALVPAMGDSPLGATPFLVAVAAYGWLMFKIIVPFSSRFPASCETVGGLTEMAIISSFKSSPELPANAVYNEIWRRVQALVADEIGVSLEEVTPNADFVRDLGLG